MGASRTPDTDIRSVDHHSGFAEFLLKSRSHSPKDFGNQRAVQRFLYSWRLTSRYARAGIGIIHGLGEHAGRYSKVAAFFVQHGYDVWSFDQQGHGHDSAARGVVNGYDQLLDEVGSLHQRISQELPDRPVFLIGHSMGGNLVLNYALRRDAQPSAIIASSPMFRTPKEPKGVMKIVARVAARLAPNLRIPTGIETRWLTNCEEELVLVNRDPLYHRRVSLRLGAALIDSGLWAIENAQKLKVPTLITHGTNDQLTMPEGSKEFADRAGRVCRFELLPNHLHETFRDTDGQRVLQLWIDFFDSHCKA